MAPKFYTAQKILQYKAESASIIQKMHKQVHFFFFLFWYQQQELNATYHCKNEQSG